VPALVLFPGVSLAPPPPSGGTTITAGNFTLATDRCVADDALGVEVEALSRAPRGILQRETTAKRREV